MRSSFTIAQRKPTHSLRKESYYHSTSLHFQFTVTVLTNCKIETHQDFQQHVQLVAVKFYIPDILKELKKSWTTLHLDKTLCIAVSKELRSPLKTKQKNPKPCNSFFQTLPFQQFNFTPAGIIISFFYVYSTISHDMYWQY